MRYPGPASFERFRCCPALCAITAIYLLRGLVIVPLVVLGKSTPFWWWSSMICLLIGSVHLAGLSQVWARL